MTPFPRTLPVAGLVLAIVAAAAPADETSDKQKKAAADNLKKADVAKMAVAETDNLIVCAPLTEARTRAVAEAAQKSYKLGRKVLQFDDKDEAWKGKLTVYVLPERAGFLQFMRLVVGVKPETTAHVAVRGDEPFVVSGAELSAKAADADVVAEVAPLVGGALLASKVGPSNPLPQWARVGFGRAVALRAEGPNGKRLAAYKTQARAAVLGGGARPPARLAGAWGDDPNADLIATAVMDYLAFGPDGKNFPKFAAALQLTENGEPPTPAMIFETAMLKMDATEAGWRKWAQGGMVAR